MEREKALRLAIELVDGQSIPKNDRGYPVDGWRPPDARERHHQVMKTAKFLAAGPLELTEVIGADGVRVEYQHVYHSDDRPADDLAMQLGREGDDSPMWSIACQDTRCPCHAESLIRGDVNYFTLTDLTKAVAAHRVQHGTNG
jgi:hypothetical protein